MSRKHSFVAAVLMLFFALTAFSATAAAPTSYEEGRKLLGEGRTEEGVLKLEQAVREYPRDAEIRAQYYRQREMLSSRWLNQAETARNAGRLGEAEQIYMSVFRIDPNNERAKGGLNELRQARRHEAMLREAERALKKGDVAGAEQTLRTLLSENPTHVAARAMQRRLREEEAREQVPISSIKGPFAKPISLEFRDAPLRAAFEAMSRTAGLNFVLDKDVRADARVTLFVRNTTIEEALRLILVTNQLERKLLNENSVLIYPNTAAKTKDYQETVVKSFYLVNTEAKQAQALIKSMIKSKDIFIDEKLNLVVVKDTPDGIRLAEKLIESLDLALPEVMLEVEVLEVSRTRMMNLGIEYPGQIGYGILQPNTSTAISTAAGITQTTNLGGKLQEGNVDLRNTSGLTTYVANPALVLNIKKQDGDSKLLANPRIRVINREKAKIHIGDKLPVFTTTSTANVGVSASVNYLDVGLKLEVEPRVFLDEDVEMKVSLEVSSIVKEIPGPSSSLAYQIGSRSAVTSLRLRDGETQILAGLINDEERMTASKVPGLGDIPVLGRLFSTQNDSSSKTEIVLLITPRVIRNVARPQSAAPVVSSGTESAIGSQALSIKQGALRGIASVGGGAGLRQGEVQYLPHAGEAMADAQPMILSVPAQAKPGQALNMTLSVTAPGAVSGIAEVMLDPSQFDVAASTVTLSGSGGNLRGDFSANLKPGLAAGSAQVLIGSASLVDSTGGVIPVSLPAPQAVQLLP